MLRYILNYVLHERARCSLLVLSMVTFRQPIFFCSLQVSVTKHSYKIVFIVQNRNYLGKYLYYKYQSVILFTFMYYYSNIILGRNSKILVPKYTNIILVFPACRKETDKNDVVSTKRIRVNEWYERRLKFFYPIVLWHTALFARNSKSNETVSYD